MFSPAAVINPSLAFSIIPKLHNLCTQDIGDVFEVSCRERSSVGAFSHWLQHKPTSAATGRRNEEKTFWMMSTRHHLFFT